MSDWLIFEDEVYTPAEITAKIETSLAERSETRPDSWANRLKIPSYGTISEIPTPPEELPYSAQLFHHLRQANRLATQLTTDADLADSTAVRIPILGKLWKRIRREAHNLVLFYVNRLAAEQSQITAQLLGTVNELTQQNIDLQRQVAELQQALDRSKDRSEESGS